MAYIRGRYIGQNIRTISDVIEYYKTTNQPGIIACLDFEKAFDSIEWSFIQKSLETFNFGENFCKWINIFYCNVSACVTNNGYASQPFLLSRGIRQGCPISAYLFIIAVELLAIEIRANKSIEGIKISDFEIKITQMADDTTVYVLNLKSMEKLLEVLKLFQNAAGLKLNTSKTDALIMGKHGDFRNGALGINWKKDKIFSLGIWYCINTEEG